MQPLVHWSDTASVGAHSSESRLWTIIDVKIIDYIKSENKNASEVHISRIERDMLEIVQEIVELPGDYDFEKKLFCNQVRNICRASHSTVTGILAIARRRAKEADVGHRREVIGQVRKWFNKAMEAHATAAHAYLRKADVGSYVFAGEDNDGTVIIFDPPTFRSTKKSQQMGRNLEERPTRGA